MDKSINNKEDYVGKEFQTKNYGKCVILYYGSFREVIVMFYEPLAIVKCSLSSLKEGAVKNPYFPSVFGKGFLGSGIYSTLNKRAYCLWVSMLNRAYGKDFQLKYPAYLDVEVCKEWLNFQKFAKWCYSNNFINSKDDGGRRYQMDKDILVKGNKVYSPETCCFIPKDINLIFSKSTSDFPIGVRKVGKYFIATVNCYGCKKYLGTYDTAEDAFYSYKEAKESYIKDVAEKWKGKIDTSVYNALVNYEVEITD